MKGQHPEVDNFSSSAFYPGFIPARTGDKRGHNDQDGSCQDKFVVSLHHAIIVRLQWMHFLKTNYGKLLQGGDKNVFIFMEHKNRTALLFET
jgi:hypothetical protein